MCYVFAHYMGCLAFIYVTYRLTRMHIIPGGPKNVPNICMHYAAE